MRGKEATGGLLGDSLTASGGERGPARRCEAGATETGMMLGLRLPRFCRFASARACSHEDTCEDLVGMECACAYKGSVRCLVRAPSFALCCRPLRAACSRSALGGSEKCPKSANPKPLRKPQTKKSANPKTYANPKP